MESIGLVLLFGFFFVFIPAMVFLGVHRDNRRKRLKDDLNKIEAQRVEFDPELPKRRVIERDGSCERCGRRPKNIQTYYFYCGHTRGGSSEYTIEGHVFTTRYQIDPNRRTAAICKSCIRLYIIKRIVIPCAIAIVSMLLTLAIRREACCGIGIVALVIVLIGWGESYAHYPSYFYEIGDRLAIRVKEHKLKEEGYDAFFTRGEFRRLY